jgi:hypothetical protein
MQELLVVINQGWVGSVIGVIGIVIGVYCYRLSKKTAKLVYQKASFRSFGKQENRLPKEVTVQFRGKEIDRLSYAILVLWNDGVQTIDGKSIVEKDPIQIAFNKGDKILNAVISKQTRLVNEFNLIMDESESHIVGITFSFLDPGDGATIEIMHDSKLRYPKLKGTIKGIPEGIVDLGWPSVGPFRTMREVLVAILPKRKEQLAGFIVGSLLVASVFAIVKSYGGGAFAAFCGLAILIITLPLLWLFRTRRCPVPLNPLE